MHKIFVSISLPYEIGFQEMPNYRNVVMDIYISCVFFLEIIATFNKSFYDVNSRLVTDRKVIAREYLTSWFILDVIALFPLTYFKYSSLNEPRSLDEIKSFLTGNFNSMPRLYKIL